MRAANIAIASLTTANSDTPLNESHLPVVISPGCPLQCRVTYGEPGTNTMMISIQSPERDCSAPVDICCVVDISGSMGGDAGIANAQGVKESHGFSYLDIVKHSV